MTQVFEHGCLADAHLASHRLEFHSIDKAQLDHASALLGQVVTDNRVYFQYSSLVRPIFFIVLAHFCEI